MKNSKLTIGEILLRFKNTHGNRFDYSKVAYTGINNKIIITCPIHHDFETLVYRHVNSKYGACPKCVESRVKVTLEEWLLRARAAHTIAYDYKLVERDFYLKEDKLKIICPVHGIFEQTRNSHITGRGCTKCGIDRRPQNNAKTSEQFIKEAKEKHKDFYDYSKSMYVSATAKLVITCPAHGDFSQRPNDHLTGYGCDLCGRERKTGVYSINKLEKDAAFANTIVRFYIIQLERDNESYRKFGITKTSVFARHKATRRSVDVYEELLEFKTTALIARKLELYFHDIIGDNKYSPNCNFAGHTECFKTSADYYQIIYDFFYKEGNK